MVTIDRPGGDRMAETIDRSEQRQGESNRSGSSGSRLPQSGWPDGTLPHSTCK